MNSSKQLTGVFVILGLFLGGFLLWATWPLMTGTEVVLETRPVDPFDPLRGQYMTIRYTIGSLDAEEFSEGDTIYVKLRQNGSVWVADGTSHDKPDGLFIKGSVNRVSGSSVGRSSKVKPA